MKGDLGGLLVVNQSMTMVVFLQESAAALHVQHLLDFASQLQRTHCEGDEIEGLTVTTDELV